MTAALVHDAVNETFADMEKLIYHTIHQFIKRYGGSFDEMAELIGPMFMTAYTHYDKRKGKFTTCLRWVIWKQLLDYKRNEIKRTRAVVYTELDPEQHQAPRMFNVTEFMDELSDDAKTVVRMVFDTPWAFYDQDPKRIRFVLRLVLGQLEWSPARISRSFQDVRRALGGRPN
jgi:DNA-directed RNA polymerase specialized sigma24 family protein